MRKIVACNILADSRKALNGVLFKRTEIELVGYEKTNAGPMRRPFSILFGYEKTNNGPMKSPWSTVTGLEKTIDGTMAKP